MCTKNDFIEYFCLESSGKDLLPHHITKLIPVAMKSQFYQNWWLQPHSFNARRYI